MSKAINKKAIVYESKTSIFIFLYPIAITMIMAFYSIKNLNINTVFIFLSISLLLFIPAFLNFHNKHIFVTKNSIYLYSRDKIILKWSLQNDLYIVDVKQDKLGKIFGYGTLILANQNKEMYEYFFLNNPEKFKDEVMFSYEKLMKKLDPSFVSSYKVNENRNDETKLDAIED